jgi:nitrous oxide reductase accessory protein NosL
MAGGKMRMLLIIASASAVLLACNEMANRQMASIEAQVAQDSVVQYNIAKQQGDKMQICVQAGIVSASYLQAKDQANYNKWKAIEKKDCAAAGLPQ